jgi:SOS-response transcriptional repressor LexA
MHQIDLGSTIKELMDAQNIDTLAELARLVDVPQQTLHRIISGATTNPQVATLQAIASYFHVNVSQLLGEEPIAVGSNQACPFITKIPLLKWEDISHWKRLTERYTPDNWQYWAITKYELSQNAYALNIQSHTMPPPFSFDSILIVDPTIKPQDGNFVISYRVQDHSASIKRFETDGADHYLMPLKDIGNPVLLDKEHTICGTIIKIDVNLLRG